MNCSYIENKLNPAIFFRATSILIAFAIVFPLFSNAPENSSHNIDSADYPRVALVLQGGGALGIAHISVIKMIEKLGIPIDLVVGTSMGSIVGGLYSIGYSGEELERLVLETDWVHLFVDKSLPSEERFWDREDRSRHFLSQKFDKMGLIMPSGLLPDRRILTYFDRLTLSVPTPTNFNALPCEFRAVSTDIETGARVVLDHGSLSEAMRASMSIPGVFSPFLMDGRYLVDGFLVDNLPIDVARELHADIVIAIQLTGGIPFSKETINRSPVASLSRSIDIMTENSVAQQLSQADYVLNINLQGFQAGDFQKGKEILEISDDAVQKHAAEFLSLKQRILNSGKTAKERRTMKSDPFDKIITEGAYPKDKSFLFTMVQPEAGTAPDLEKLKGALDILDNEGNYSSIRISRIVLGTEHVLKIAFEKKSLKENDIVLGFSSASSYGGVISSIDIIYAGVIFRGFPYPSSRITLGFENNSQPSLEAVWLQPFARYFFAEASYKVRSEIDTYISDELESYALQKEMSTLSYRMGFTPFNFLEFAAGIQYDQIERSDSFPEILAGPEITSTLFTKLDYKLLLLDSFIFPQHGYCFTGSYHLALSQLYNQRQFQIAEMSGCAVTPFNIPLSVEFEWKLGTDFTVRGNDQDNSAPSIYKPDLSNRRMFPGLMKINERIGSHVGGASILAKYQLNWEHRKIGMPIFLFLHGAAGSTLQNFDHFRSISHYSYWNCDLGIGMRLNDGFGLMMRVGSYCGFSGTNEGFLALDIGSFGIR